MIMNIYKNSNNKAGTNKRPENWNLKMRGSKIMPGTSKYKNISTSETNMKKESVLTSPMTMPMTI